MIPRTHYLTFVSSAPKRCHVAAIERIVGTWKLHKPYFVSEGDLKELRRQIDRDRTSPHVHTCTPLLMVDSWVKQGQGGFGGWRANEGGPHDAASLIYIDDYIAYMYRQIEWKDVRSAIDMALSLQP